MRIVNRTEFLAMPPGTLFKKYDAMDFGELMIKGETAGTSDFYYTELLDNWILGNGEDTDEIYRAEKDSTYEIKVSNDCLARDGFPCDDDQLFAIFSHDELMTLIVKLMITWNGLTDSHRAYIVKSD